MKSYGKVEIRGYLVGEPKVDDRGRAKFRVAVVHRVGGHRGVLERTESHTVHAWGRLGSAVAGMPLRAEVLVEGDLRSWRRRSSLHGGWDAGTYVRAWWVEQVGPPAAVLELPPAQRAGGE